MNYSYSRWVPKTYSDAGSISRSVLWQAANTKWHLAVVSYTVPALGHRTARIYCSEHNQVHGCLPDVADYFEVIHLGVGQDCNRVGGNPKPTLELLAPVLRKPFW